MQNQRATNTGGPAMNRFLGVSLTALLAASSVAHGEVVVQTPVGVMVFGRNVPRCGPGVDVQVGRIVGVHVNPGPPAPAPIVVPQPDRESPTPTLPPPTPLNAPAPPAAMTLQEFAATFKPCAGTYEACIIHPRTCEPVKVTFCLPDAPVCKVRVTKREIDFEYPGKHTVSIRFRLNGSVTVSNN
jgi:hypothetical protein